VTQNKKLYTWGNGFYGRLGTGFEIKELYPTLVVDLSEKEVVRVSCGAFHTLCLTQDGKLWAFGNDKYGKLGLGTKEMSN
jgi:alpha-tubulin suppressor-like RCC1 family protein